MSSPTTDIDFDGAVDRAWADFTTGLTRRLAGPDARCSFDIDTGSDAARTGSPAILAFRGMPGGVVGAVVAVPPATITATHPGWSEVSPGRLGRFVGTTDVAELAASAVGITRAVWGVPHPSFLHDEGAARDHAGSVARRRARAMADHPSASLSHVVAHVVRDRLEPTVEVDTHDCIELTYPTATASLQVWTEHRSALFWTTIRGAVDPDVVERTRGVIDLPTGFEMIVDGAVVDIEFAVDLTTHARTEMATALDRWNDFMTVDLAAITDLLTAPRTPDELDMPHVLRIALARNRDGAAPSPDEITDLVGSDRGAVFEALDVCRRQSSSWLRWAQARSARADVDGVHLAVAEARLFDTAYTQLVDSLRCSMVPHPGR